MRNAIAAALTVLALSNPVMAQEEAAMGGGPLITVTGTGEIDAAPDMAVLELGTVLRAEESADVLDEASAVTAALIDAMVEAGIAEADIQTRRAALRPIFPRSDTGEVAPVPEAYEMQSMLSVTIRDLAQVGDVFAAGSDAGATRFEGLRFELSDPSAALADARAAAVADAKLRAETYAAAAGLQIGQVLSISEPGSSAAPRPLYADMAAEARAMPVAPGSLTVNARITIVYALTE